MSSSLQPHGLQKARIFSLWDFPGKNTGEGCQFLPQGLTAEALALRTVKYFENGGAAKMANDARVKITLVCTECKQRNYDTKKNKKNDPDRLELKKYCRFCRKHTLHKESK